MIWLTIANLAVSLATLGILGHASYRYLAGKRRAAKTIAGFGQQIKSDLARFIAEMGTTGQRDDGQHVPPPA